jgi:hypothetical protein
VAALAPNRYLGASVHVFVDWTVAPLEGNENTLRPA